MCYLLESSRILKNFWSIIILSNSFHNLIKLSPKTILSFGVSSISIIFQPLQIRTLFNIQSKQIHVYSKAKDNLQCKVLIILIFLVAMYPFILFADPWNHSVVNVINHVKLLWLDFLFACFCLTVMRIQALVYQEVNSENLHNSLFNKMWMSRSRG